MKKLMHSLKNTDIIRAVIFIQKLSHSSPHTQISKAMICAHNLLLFWKSLRDQTSVDSCLTAGHSGSHFSAATLVSVDAKRI